MQVLPHLHLELAAVERRRSPASRRRRARRRPPRRSRRCRWRMSPPPRARRSAPGSARARARRTTTRSSGWGTARDARSRGPIAARSSALEPASSSTADRALRVADLDVLEAPASPSGRQLAAPVGGARREVVARSRARPMLDRAGRRPVIVARISPGRRLDRERVGVVQPLPAQVQDRLARAVARQLGLGAVWVEDPQPGDERPPLGRRVGEQQDPVGEHAGVGCADRPGSGRASARTAASAPRRSRSRCRAPATSRSPRGPESRSLAAPGWRRSRDARATRPA